MFPPEFCNHLYTIYTYTKYNHIPAEKIKKYCTVSKWRPKNRFSFRVISISTKIWKTTYPKEFFNEIWLKLGDHRYINIAEIKFGKYYSGGILGAKQFFPHPPKMLINANYFVNDAADLNFFFRRKKRNYYLGNYKNYQPEILRR